MKTLDVSQLKRRPNLQKKLLKLTSSKQYTITDDCSIVFPERYINKDLAEIDDKVRLIGIFALLDSKGNYTVCNIPTYLYLSPFTVLDIEINDVPYKQLIFKKDTLFLENIKLVKNSSFIFNLFDEFFIKGRIPWFMEYEELAEIFKYGKKYADTNIGNNVVTMEVITSILARNPKDRLQYFRTTVNKKEDKEKKSPVYVPLESIYYSFSNTTNKLIGSYMEKGITSALINKTEEVENVERLLRA